jgi:hypothetical protein
MWLLPLGLLAIVGVAIVGVRIFLGVSGTETVVAATSVVPGQYLQEDDLRIQEVDSYSIDSDAVMNDLDDAVSHLALGALAEGSPLGKAAITAVAAPSEVEEKLQLRFRTEDVTISDVKTGQRVQLLFAPLGVPDAPQAQAIKAILIAHPNDGEDGVVWVAITSSDRDALLDRLARARLIIAPAS